MFKIPKEWNLTKQGKIGLLIQGLGFLAFMVVMVAFYVALPALQGV